MPGQVTGSSGCTTWLDLAPDLEYGVEEDLPAEWQALTPASHSFGVAGTLEQLAVMPFRPRDVAILPSEPETPARGRAECRSQNAEV